MAKINLKDAYATCEIKSFGGIVPIGSRTDGKSAYDVCNFRICEDGSLEKRCGFGPLMSLPGTPRAFWNGYISGTPYTFALIGNTVYHVDMESSESEALATVTETTGEASFFLYRGVLYLIDGHYFYRYASGQFSEFEGYIPLYGKDCPGRYTDEVYEDVNILSDKIRMHYDVTSDRSTFYIGIKCAELISFYVGENDRTQSAQLSSDGMSIRYNVSVTTRAEVRACLRLAPESIADRGLFSCRRATVFGGKDDARAVLYGGSDRSALYASRKVSDASMRASRAEDANSQPVYFPVSDKVSVSDGRYPVKTVCPHYDRLLIFTEQETYCATFDNTGTEFEVRPVNSSIGCLSPAGAILAGNSPYTLSEGGVYRWTANDDERDNCNAICVSDNINDRLSREFLERAVMYYYRKRNELWISDPYDPDQQVFIYMCGRGEWFRYDGIPVDSFFTFKGNVAMLYGAYIFTFSEDYLRDYACEGGVSSQIMATYDSCPCDFGHPETTMRLKRIFARMRNKGEIMFRLEGDSHGVKYLVIKNTENTDMYFDCHADVGRIRTLMYQMTADRDDRFRLHSLSLVTYQ